MKNFYITTAIDYANDVIHIGHAYQKILADILARYHREIGDNTYFLTGTDEHGQKVERAAQAAKIPPQEFVDNIVKQNVKQWKSLDISYDRYIRTTDPDHIKLVEEIFEKCTKNKDIYLAKYEGLYCESCEDYLQLNKLINGKCPQHPTKTPIKVAEQNYFFALSKYQNFIEELIANDPNFIQPEDKRKEILSFVKEGLKDFPVSRNNVAWGIPVPGKPQQTIYVWFDALINYLTYGLNQNCWPATVHVLGKDNLRFHAVYWPAILKSAGYELPQTILVHDFINLNGQKISKSLGNVILPEELVNQFNADGVRYFFARYGPLNNDIDVTSEKIGNVYNFDLANGLGNLVSRVAALCQKSNLSFSNKFPNKFSSEIINNLEKYKINSALEAIWRNISKADSLINIQKPWELSGEKLEKVLSELVEIIRQIAFDLKPFLPQISFHIQKQFNQGKITSEKPLFPRI